MKPQLKISLHGEESASWAGAVRSALAAVQGINLCHALDVDCDAVLDFTGRFTPENFPRLGIWRFDFAGRPQPSGATLRALDSGALETALWSHGANGDKFCLVRSFGALEPYAPRRSTSQALAKTVQFPARAAKRLLGGASLESLHGEAIHAGPFQNHPPAFTNAPRMASAWIRKAWHKLAHREQWYIELERLAGSRMTAPPRETVPVYPPSDRFWADPFLAQHQGRTWLFVEELFFGHKGHIAVMEINDEGRAGPPVVALERPYHLSYPFVFEWDGAWWMLPETSHNQTVELYRCERFPGQWILEKTLLQDVRAADSTILEFEGRWWLFCSMASPDASIHDELHVYFADSPLGPWLPHTRNPVKSDARSSRPAGALFRDGGTLIRPAQDCGMAYGRAIALNRVDVLTPDDFAESVMEKIEPGWRNEVIRTHTLNQAGSWRVLDALRYLPK